MCFFGKCNGNVPCYSLNTAKYHGTRPYSFSINIYLKIAWFPHRCIVCKFWDLKQVNHPLTLHSECDVGNLTHLSVAVLHIYRTSFTVSLVVEGQKWFTVSGFYQGDGCLDSDAEETPSALLLKTQDWTDAFSTKQNTLAFSLFPHKPLSCAV